MIRRITLKEIAKIAGCSVSTVSKALNYSNEVSEATKKRILEIARSNNYFFNRADHMLLRGEKRIIGLLIPDVSNPYFSRLWSGIEDIARANDYAVVACHTREDPNLEKEQIQRILHAEVNGILAIPVNEKNYRGIDIPVVLLSRCSVSNNKANYVINNDFRGAYLGAKYLLEQNKKNIFFLSGPKDISVAESRSKGLLNACREYGLPFTENSIYYDNLTLKDGFKTTQKIIKQYRSDQTSIGIFCSSDVVAIGALNAARVNKLRIPEEISIVGYDNLEIDAYMDYQLTTISQADYQIGSQGMKVLLDIMTASDDLSQSHQITFEPEIVIRMT